MVDQCVEYEIYVLIHSTNNISMNLPWIKQGFSGPHLLLSSKQSFAYTTTVKSFPIKTWDQHHRHVCLIFQLSKLIEINNSVTLTVSSSQGGVICTKEITWTVKPHFKLIFLFFLAYAQNIIKCFLTRKCHSEKGMGKDRR